LDRSLPSSAPDRGMRQPADDDRIKDIERCFIAPDYPAPTVMCAGRARSGRRVTQRNEHLTKVIIRTEAHQSLELLLGGDPLAALAGKQLDSGERISALRQKCSADGPTERPLERDDCVVDEFRLVASRRLVTSRPRCIEQMLLEFLGVESSDVSGQPIAMQFSELDALLLIVLEGVLALLRLDRLEEQNEELLDGET
jgi:hypothetical protein